MSEDNVGPGALAGATEAQFKADELPKTDNAALAARHPIIATHWGITA